MVTSPSPQYGSMMTPYGTIGLGAPAAAPGGSVQMGAAGASAFGMVRAQTRQAMPGAGAPGEPGAVAPPAAPGMAGAAAGTAAPALGPAGAAGAAGLPESALAGLAGEVGAGAAAFAPPNMIGDQSPFGFHALQNVGPPGSVGPPPPPGSRAATVPYPTVRAFKISENMSPRPQDRVFFDFNYYNNVNSQINQYDGVPIYRMKAYRYMFGFEKTFDEGRGSLGMRLPIDNLTADPLPGAQGIRTPTRTAVGNLDMFAKYILKACPQTGSLISAGLLLSAPTGPGRFAGAPYVFGLNDLSIQPFLGYICNRRDWYFQGFSGFYFPTIINDLTFMYNDIGVGYYLLRSEDPSAFLTAVVPSFELHVNSPFTHTNWHNRLDVAAQPTVLNLTYGVNFQLQRSAILTAAFIQPVTSPQPFSAEVAVFLNIFYGRSRAGQIPIQPPPL
jgi:hypothetical protein